MNDGGPAFPRSAQQAVNMQEGMSLRDYFALGALQCVAKAAVESSIAMANHGITESGGKSITDLFNTRSWVAESYQIADQMIEQRSKP